MGVSGLLKQLKSITNDKFHIKELKGMRVAIDACCLLHKGCYNCSEAVVLQQPTTVFVNYIISTIDMLHSYGIHEIILVFDGINLIAKKDTNKFVLIHLTHLNCAYIFLFLNHSQRNAMRDANYNIAMEYKAQGEAVKAEQHFKRSVSITCEMVQQVLKELESREIYYMIAPYEADAQLAYLSMNNLVDAVITEDSDVLIYGCRHVIFKLDKNSGTGHQIIRKNLGSNIGMSFTNWNDEQFTLFCCLAGSDYSPTLKNMGIKTAHKYVSTHQTFDKVVAALKSSWKSAENTITNEFISHLWKAFMTYRHQCIYNPLEWRMQYLRPITEERKIKHSQIVSGLSTMKSNIKSKDLEDHTFDFLGKILPNDIAEKLVRGFIAADKIHGLMPCAGDEIRQDLQLFQTVKDTVQVSIDVNERPSNDIQWRIPDNKSPIQFDKQSADSKPDRIKDKPNLHYCNNTNDQIIKPLHQIEFPDIEGAHDEVIWGFTEANDGTKNESHTVTTENHFKIPSISSRQKPTMFSSNSFTSGLVSDSFESLQRKKRRITSIPDYNHESKENNNFFSDVIEKDENFFTDDNDTKETRYYEVSEAQDQRIDNRNTDVELYTSALDSLCEYHSQSPVTSEENYKTSIISTLDAPNVTIFPMMTSSIRETAASPLWSDNWRKSFTENNSDTGISSEILPERHNLYSAIVSNLPVPPDNLASSRENLVTLWDNLIH